VTACWFCNEARNRTIYEVEGNSPEEIVALKPPQIQAARAPIWRIHVEALSDG
jgi:hypothetical protein